MMDFTPYKKMKYYLVLFILILSILYYFVNIENFSEEISTVSKNLSDGSDTKGFHLSMTPNGMNVSLNWFGKKLIDSSKWKCSSSMGDIRSIRKNSKGIVECASNNGASCIKHLNNVECINYNKLKNDTLKNDSMTPYLCAPMNDTDNMTNWCASGYRELNSEY